MEERKDCGGDAQGIITCVAMLTPTALFSCMVSRRNEPQLTPTVVAIILSTTRMYSEAVRSASALVKL